MTSIFISSSRKSVDRSDLLWQPPQIVPYTCSPWNFSGCQFIRQAKNARICLPDWRQVILTTAMTASGIQRRGGT
jgi:hypothetical protein